MKKQLFLMNCLFVLSFNAYSMSSFHETKEQHQQADTTPYIRFDKFKSHLDQAILAAPKIMGLTPLTYNRSGTKGPWKNYQLHNNLTLMVKVDNDVVSQITLLSSSKDRSIDKQMAFIQETLVKLYSPEVEPASKIISPVMERIQQAEEVKSYSYRQGMVIYRMEGKGKVTSFVVRPISYQF